LKEKVTKQSILRENGLGFFSPMIKGDYFFFAKINAASTIEASVPTGFDLTRMWLPLNDL